MYFIVEPLVLKTQQGCFALQSDAFCGQGLGPHEVGHAVVAAGPGVFRLPSTEIFRSRCSRKSRRLTLQSTSVQCRIDEH